MRSRARERGSFSKVYVVIAPIKLKGLAEFARHLRGRGRAAHEVTVVALPGAVVDFVGDERAVKKPPANEPLRGRGLLGDLLTRDIRNNDDPRAACAGCLTSSRPTAPTPCIG